MAGPLALRSGTPNRSSRGTVNKQWQPRTRGPSVEAWERVKPFIMRYYVEEGLNQDEILNLLSKKHGHDVKLNMLKTRLRQWNMKKNYTKAEKQAAAKELKRRSDLGLESPVEVKIDGRHPSWDRVYRQCRNDAEYTSPWLQKNTEWRALVSRLCLKTCPTDHFLELTLRDVSTYWGIIIVGQEKKPETKSYEPQALRIGFLGGLELIKKGRDKQGWREIHTTCGKVINVFRSREPDLLAELFSLFSARSWTVHPQLLSAIAKYVLNVSRDLVGSEHPLSHILRMFVALLAEDSLEAFGIVPELALKVMLDLVEQEREVKIASFYIRSLEVSLMDKINGRLGQHAVRQLVQAKFSHYRATLGERNQYTLSMLSDIAQMHLCDARGFDPRENGHEKEASERKAEKILLKIVRQGEKFPDDLSRVGSYLLAARDLARLYFSKQDFQNAHRYYGLAVLWSARKLGPFHSFTSLVVDDYEALQKLVGLGLVDIKPEEEEHDRQLTCNQENQPGQDSQDFVLEAATSTQFAGGPEFTPITLPGNESSSQGVGNVLPASTNEDCEGAHNENALLLESVFELHSPSADLFIQAPEDSYVWTPGTPAPGGSQGIVADMAFDEPATSSRQGPPIFFQDNPPEFNLDMDNMDNMDPFLDWQSSQNVDGVS
ncbi:hypothetical protein AYL99_07293 [Fonsecaea erecta]|uniref:Clr5 domain-containing protein n=1 Tax=Fonsecaea erecta TaxID=1367422 RepID=A0A178ZG86_9EURO|nr:hypothetical protein AYL99_07293 [Fonsecaea erecta]OAP58203.1 hypothetical protein AYL99_07293 [Fonsecaea erecta]